MKTKRKYLKESECREKSLKKISKNEKGILVLDNDLKGLITILKPSNTSKIYEKFE